MKLNPARTMTTRNKCRFGCRSNKGAVRSLPGRNYGCGSQFCAAPFAHNAVPSGFGLPSDSPGIAMPGSPIPCLRHWSNKETCKWESSHDQKPLTAESAEVTQRPQRRPMVQLARVSMVSPFSTNACIQPRTRVQPRLWPCAASRLPAKPSWRILTNVPVPTRCGPRCCRP